MNEYYDVFRVTFDTDYFGEVTTALRGDTILAASTNWMPPDLTLEINE